MVTVIVIMLLSHLSFVTNTSNHSTSVRSKAQKQEHLPHPPHMPAHPCQEGECAEGPGHVLQSQQGDFPAVAEHGQRRESWKEPREGRQGHDRGQGQGQWQCEERSVRSGHRLGLFQKARTLFFSEAAAVDFSYFGSPQECQLPMRKKCCLA